MRCRSSGRASLFPNVNSCSCRRECLRTAVDGMGRVGTIRNATQPTSCDVHGGRKDYEQPFHNRDRRVYRSFPIHSGQHHQADRCLFQRKCPSYRWGRGHNLRHRRRVDPGRSVHLGTIQISNASYQGYNIGFNGTMWGLGLGGGVSYGALTLTVPPAQLNNLAGSFQITNAAALVTVQFWNSNNGYIGNYSGPALAVAAGVFGGSGTWTATK